MAMVFPSLIGPQFLNPSTVLIDQEINLRAGLDRASNRRFNRKKTLWPHRGRTQFSWWGKVYDKTTDLN